MFGLNCAAVKAEVQQDKPEKKRCPLRDFSPCIQAILVLLLILLVLLLRILICVW